MADSPLILPSDEEEGCRTIWGCTACDFDFPNGDRLLAARLPLLLATQNQTEAGWRTCRGGQHLGGPGWSGFRPVGHGWR
jgi:hypothetical protein